MRAFDGIPVDDMEDINALWRVVTCGDRSSLSLSVFSQCGDEVRVTGW